MDENLLKHMRSSQVKQLDRKITTAFPEDEDEIDRDNKAKQVIKDIEDNKQSLKRRHDIAIVLNSKCTKEIAEVIIKDIESHGFDAILGKLLSKQSQYHKGSIFYILRQAIFDEYFVSNIF